MVGLPDEGQLTWVRLWMMSMSMIWWQSMTIFRGYPGDLVDLPKAGQVNRTVLTLSAASPSGRGSWNGCP